MTKFAFSYIVMPYFICILTKWGKENRNTVTDPSGSEFLQKLERVNIEIDVPADIPLLLSKASMKRAGTVLDRKNGRAVMFNKKKITLKN